MTYYCPGCNKPLVFPCAIHRIDEKTYHADCWNEVTELREDLHAMEEELDGLHILLDMKVDKEEEA